MTPENSLRLPELTSQAKGFIKSHSGIWDIALYGSAVRGTQHPRDIDIAIILEGEMTLSKKLSLAQELKAKLAHLHHDVDVRAISFSDLTDQTFIARSGIIAEGYSLTKKVHLHRLFGFKTCTLFTYSQKSLTLSQKKMFYYALHGRRGNPGLLKLKHGAQLSPGALKVPLEHTQEFEDIFHQHNITYTIRKASFY
ncbi:MAG: nucleotidyltransferase domain-containing protein [Nanoarchaeota archaeon]